MLVLLVVVVVAVSARARRGQGGKGEAGDGGFDHRAHAVAGAQGYLAVDFEREGSAEVALDGSRSHSHYFDPGPPVVTGRVEKYAWFVNDGKKSVFSSAAAPTARFPVGTTEIGLTVVDNTGDTHTDFANVTVSPPDAPGAFCYYYAVSGDGEGGGGIPVADDFTAAEGPGAPKPVSAEQRGSGIDFPSVDSFPPQFRGGPFVVRCVFQLRGGAAAREVQAVVAHDGGPFKMVVGETVVVDSSQAGAVESAGTATGFQVPAGEGASYDAQVIFYRSGTGAAALVVTGIDDMQLDLGRVTPVLLAVEPTSSTLVGGGRGKVVGIGMSNGVRVKFGDVALTTTLSNIDTNTAFFVVPRAASESVVQVSVQNNVGSSNSKPFEFSSTGLPPLKFSLLTLAGASGSEIPALLTGIVYGPDHRWYASSLDGHVYSFEISRDLKVSSVCKSPSVGKDRAVLSVAFNPADLSPRVYAATSVLDWKVKGKINSADGWKNGIIMLFESSGGDGSACLKKVKDVITGLPVSNHDHGINGMVFDQAGDLHFQVGGFTNAGHNTEGNMLGGLDETVLSAASLVASVVNPSFDGTITYDSNDPGTARQTGGDVSVFSPGFRNSFGICYHSRGLLLATDNGASLGFGDVSTSCTTNEPLISHKPDKLVKVVKGKFYGSPNRNRGRDDPRQCTYVDAAASRTADFEAPIATLQSSSNGVMEVTSNLLGGQLKGNVLVSKYSTSEDPGLVYRIRLNGKNEVDPGGVDSLSEASGLTIAQSPWGDFIMPRVYGGEIVALRPLYDVPSIPVFAAVLPFRGPAGGGNVVQISGHNFGSSPTAFFGVNPCTDITNVASDGTSFRCTVPAGGKGASVQVSVAVPGTATAESTGGVDYQYMQI